MSKKEKEEVNTTAISLKLLAQDKDHDTGVSRSEIFRIDPDKVIFEKGFNVRTLDSDDVVAHIERLYLATKNGAFLPPIDVRVETGKVLCVEGHCRIMAARRWKKEFPDYTLEARQFRGNEQERTFHMLGTGSGQKALTPLEQGLGFLRLTKFGMTPQAIADKLGVSIVTINNNLALAEAPVEVQEMVNSGEVSSTTAREVVSQGPEAVEALKTAVAEERANPTAPKKNGKKKKVTAKKLAGTAAAKKPKAKAGKKYPKNGMTYTIKGVKEDEIVVKHNKADATATIDFLKANAPEGDKQIDSLIATLELAMM